MEGAVDDLVAIVVDGCHDLLEKRDVGGMYRLPS